jgi:hypothetical protein
MASQSMNQTTANKLIPCNSVDVHNRKELNLSDGTGGKRAACVSTQIPRDSMVLPLLNHRYLYV